MKKITIFPYHQDCHTLVKHRDSLTDCTVHGFLSFKEDARRINDLNLALGLIDFSYDRLMHDTDAVVIIDNYRGYRPDKYYQVIEDAIQLGKEVLITPHAQTELKLDAYKDSYSTLERLFDYTDDSADAYSHGQEITMYKSDVPIFGVLGFGKHCGKFETLLTIKEVLERNHSAVTVSPNSLGALFGCYTMPQFLYEERSFQEKIVRLNHYFKRLEKALNPELVIFGIPEGTAPFRKKEYHHFAEYPLIASYALKIDIAAFCTYFLYGPNLAKGLKSFAERCAEKFGISVQAYAISKTRYEIPNEEYEKVIYEFFSDEFIAENYPDAASSGLPIIDHANREQAIAVIENCIEILKGNVDVM
ncbi:MAG: hypothetical protein FWH57_11205 [Oscillospiraceae bacterium]|nr:hypothetical protein [Oscillospiraceae bacterium]